MPSIQWNKQQFTYTFTNDTNYEYYFQLEGATVCLPPQTKQMFSEEAIKHLTKKGKKWKPSAQDNKYGEKNVKPEPILKETKIPPVPKPPEVVPGNYKPISVKWDAQQLQQAIYAANLKMDSIWKQVGTLQDSVTFTPEEPKLLGQMEQKEPLTAFNATYIPALKCYKIVMYYEGKMYEVVLGDYEKSVPGIDEWPQRVRTYVWAYLRNLKLQIAPKEVSAFDHPGLKKTVKCPATNCWENNLWMAEQQGEIYTSDIFNLVQHINDTHKWTREQIADWLDTLDEQPIYYPKINTQEPTRLANSARVVEMSPPDAGGTKDRK